MSNARVLTLTWRLFFFALTSDFRYVLDQNKKPKQIQMNTVVILLEAILKVQ